MSHRCLAARVAAIVLLLGLLSTSALAARVEPPEHLFGLGFPTIGSLRYDDDGNLARATGFNLGLGYSVRYFTGSDPWEPEKLNPYWGWGTIILFIPYIEFGFSYPIPLGEGDRFLVVDFGLLYLVPYFQFSLYY